jgi:FixJ family two-component response regulator
MARVGRPKAVLELTVEERQQLTRWERRRKSSQALALRSRIVLKCAEGLANKEVADAVGVTPSTVGNFPSMTSPGSLVRRGEQVLAPGRARSRPAVG